MSELNTESVSKGIHMKRIEVKSSRVIQALAEIADRVPDDDILTMAQLSKNKPGWTKKAIKYINFL